ncbi:MAG: right-handed parallel beta-helix repeat-containing protein [Oscillospiraceae bacterium]|nr:right-handed parallel beta-helix repeat-containing protein [Oscillospiraceae bacterium]
MEYHVSKKGSNLNPGTRAEPFLTINTAAKAAQPGDIITVHKGVYREWVKPYRAGTAAKRITYQAAKGESVTITGAEVVTDWVREGNIWKTVIKNDYFGEFNPYQEVIYGDWLMVYDRVYHLGEVYLNGRSMYEATDINKVKKPVISKSSTEPEFSKYTWYCSIDDYNTTIYANFHNEDPTTGNVEINVRPHVFFPAKPGYSYITVRGFTLKQAATQWAPPTAFQEGLIGPHWSKGWIIENNIISDSKCSGISLGKDASTGHNEWNHLKFKQGTQREREVIFRAVNGNWSRDNIGSHIVRSNVIYNCGQTGIVGHLGCAFSRIESNHIYNIVHKRELAGAETGGIKLHAAIDTVISRNVIHNTHRGLWLDWQAQGTHVTRNLFFDHDSTDIFIEVSHGPTTVDHNIFLSPVSFQNIAQGIAMVHNLFAGQIALSQELNRYTPYHVPHSTAVAGVMMFPGGDDRFCNNVFIRPENDDTPDKPVTRSFFGNEPLTETEGFLGALTYTAYPVGTAVYTGYPSCDDEKAWENPERAKKGLEQEKLPVAMEGNLYLNSALPYQKEKNAAVNKGTAIAFKINRDSSNVVFHITNPDIFKKAAGKIIATDTLGHGFQAEMLFENPDETPFIFDTDFFGRPRSKKPTPGPFEVKNVEIIEISFA